MIENGVMRHVQLENAGAATGESDAVITLTRTFWLRLFARDAGLTDMLASEDFSVRGDRLALMRFFSLLETPEAGFPIVTP